MNNTPMANRVAISIFGKRNAGKSSLINALTGQSIAVISPVAGTTTDPVYKTMELLPIGPVVIIDTAGLDDVGELGNLRIEKTYEVLRKTHLAIVVISAETGLTDFELDFLADLKKRQTPTVVVFNKIDLASMTDETFKNAKHKLALPAVRVSAATGEGIGVLKELIIENAKFEDEELGLVGDLVKPGEIAILVTPIDKAAPKGRLILPQQQVIRDLLEIDAIAMITKEHELKQTLESLKQRPAIVITDSQAFLKVSADTPNDIPMTSFSILFARQKGELSPLVEGVRRLEQLTPSDKVLIVEGCTHHRQSDDIGTVKIPRWIRQIVGGDVQFEWASGVQYPKNIADYKLIVHCGGCMLNRKEMQYRIALAREHGVAITNYGMLIAYTMGILPRALKPFPAAMLALEED
ncbi:MAG: [FeFe] hydrogenase H-cluster maturation GTPase HydF [Eubacteriales bacterium]|nr:[FeFe] hydrogenase H-cluster maturation GTPase HydF [Eubacteriales bacterium]